MDEVRKKVLLDVFATPGTLLPIAGGLTTLMASWGMGGNPTLSFLGLAGILAGVGVLASRLILGLDRITRRAYDLVMERNRQEQELALEQLDRKLVEDGDPRTENCLRELRHFYGLLQGRLQPGEVKSADLHVLEGVDRLFRSCVEQLKQSHQLWQTAQRLRGSARKSLLAQRDQLVDEVCKTVSHLGESVERFYQLRVGQNRSELAQLRRELDESLQIARRVEQRTESLTRWGTQQVDYEGSKNGN